MSISIVDNFQVGISRPIDNRFVVGPNLFYNDKESIEHTYEGLRIWDINDNKPYIWKDDKWELEYDNNIIGPGTANNIAKFTDTNTIGNSIIVESSGKIYVNGTVQAINFSGIGSNITSINATNITTGTLNPSRLFGDVNEILVGNGSGSTWVNLNTITVQTSNRVSLTSSTSSTSNFLIFSNANSISQSIYTNSLLRYQPSTGNLSLSSSNFNNKLTVNGSVSIGTDQSAPNSGLLVEGSVILKGLSKFIQNNDTKYTIVTSSGDLKLDIGSTIPLGGIIIWTSDEIPDGFVICDGSLYENYLGEQIQVPDLRDKYLIGSSDIYELNNEGSMQTLSTNDISYKYQPVHFIMYIGIPNNLI